MPAAAAQLADTSEPSPSAQIGDHLVDYPAAFFARYQPVTALDMVRQLPGFQLDNGSSDRGFIAAVGNILINDVYPSAKQDSPSSILARIPANLVTRIELIRGPVRDIDLQGQPVAANVVLDGDFPATVRWDLYVRHHSEGPAKPGVDVSVSDRWKRIDYNAGVRIEREANGETGNDKDFDADRVLVEKSRISQESTGIDLTGTLNASAVLGSTLTRMNTRTHYETRNPLQVKQVMPLEQGEAPSKELVGSALTIKQFEIGGDASKYLNANLAAKGIFLFSLEQLPKTASREIFDATDNRVSSTVAVTTTDSTAVVARLELDWKGWSGHNVQFNMEGAFNALDGTLYQTIDTGSGPVEVEVPGANTLVEEIRGDFLLKDTWSIGSLKLDYGLGAEVSTITQTGDADQERHFFFLKPELVMTYSFREREQTRFRLAREVAQLDFDDFVTANVFEDDDLSLGNPDLQPDTTWVAELTQEWRFKNASVVRLTAFHDWITDVLDLLPLTPSFEAPGNIGDGRRWGIEFESTVLLDGLGLSGAKLDITALVQDSTVVDPVTGNDRVLSGEGGNNAYRTLENSNKNIRYLYRVDYRQDFSAARVAWGWTVAERDERKLFRVNEFDVRDEGYAVNTFIETTRWKNLKVSLVGDNLLNFAQVRDRTFYVGERDLTPVDSYKFEERFNGRRFTLTVSGTF
jgi:hypothetical protein